MILGMKLEGAGREVEIRNTMPLGFFSLWDVGTDLRKLFPGGTLARRDYIYTPPFSLSTRERFSDTFSNVSAEGSRHVTVARVDRGHPGPHVLALEAYRHVLESRQRGMPLPRRSVFLDVYSDEALSPPGSYYSATKFDPVRTPLRRDFITSVSTLGENDQNYLETLAVTANAVAASDGSQQVHVRNTLATEFGALKWDQLGQVWSEALAERNPVNAGRVCLNALAAR